MSPNSSNNDVIDQQQTSSFIIPTHHTPSLVDLPVADSIPEVAYTLDVTSTVCAESNHPTGFLDNENNSITQQVKEADDNDIVSTKSQYLEIRKRATQTYLSDAKKKIKVHNQFIEDLSSNYSIGDYINIKINTVDRTNTDPKILPSVILDTKENKIKVTCEDGSINQWWSLNPVVKLSHLPETLINSQTSQLEEISVVTASKLYVHGAVDGTTCSCKHGCRTKQCACKKKNLACPTKCHKNGSRCVN